LYLTDVNRIYISKLSFVFLSLVHFSLTIGHGQGIGSFCEFSPGINNEYGIIVNPSNLNLFGADGTGTLLSGSIHQYDDGEKKARVVARFASQTNPSGGYDLDMILHQGLNWEEWSTQTFITSYLDDSEVAGDSFLDWTYYILECGTLTGWGSYEGASSDLMHAPVNNFFAIQVGENTNGLNSLFGLTGWAVADGSIYDETSESLTENSNFQITFRFTMDSSSCEEIEAPIFVDLSVFETLIIPPINVCDFTEEGLQLTEVEQTYYEEISISTLEGCDLEWELISGEPIRLTEAVEGIHEFLITYEGPCHEFQEQIFSINILGCAADDSCLPFSAGEDVSEPNCGFTEIMLNASINCASEGFWEVVSGDGILADSADPNSLFQPNSGVNTLVWNSECNGEAISDTMEVVLFDVIVPDVFTGEDSELLLCEDMAVELTGSSFPEPFTGFWIQDSGPSVLIGNTSLSETTFMPIESGEYIFSWGFVDVCNVFHSAQQMVTIYDDTISAGDDLEFYLCEESTNYCFEPETISEGIEGFSWQTLDPEIEILDPTDLNACLDFNAAGEFEFVLEYGNSACPEMVSDTVLISIFNSLEPSEFCSSTPSQIITGTPASFGISSQAISDPFSGQWVQVSGNSVLAFSDTTSFETTISNIEFGFYELEWVMTDPVCETEFSCPQTIEFVPPQIDGCTLPFALNYNEEATIDDGSCEFDFFICDCDYNEHSPYTVFNLGNGTPDESANLNFNCATWGYDCGDIAQSPNSDLHGVCDLNLPPENGCICSLDGLELSIGESFVVQDSLLIGDIWQEIDVCISTILLAPESLNDTCVIEELSFSIGNGWTSINLLEQGFDFTTSDVIPFETALNQTEISFTVSTAFFESPQASIVIPECVSSITENEFEFEIYPNPTSNTLIITPYLSELYDLKLSNLQGKEIVQLTQNSGSKEIQLTDYKMSSGVYIIQLISRTGVSSKRIIYETP